MGFPTVWSSEAELEWLGSLEEGLGCPGWEVERR